MPGELNSPYRRDPFTGDFYPRWNEADEVHQATLHASTGRVGFFLHEAPQLRIPSDFICMLLADEYDEYGTALRENARLDAPDVDEFRVDYDAEDYFGTGFVEVNADLVGSWFLVGYWGLGTPPRWETYYNAQVNVSQDSAISGDLIVGRKLAVLDEYDAEMFSAEGAVISAHGNRVRDVADPSADNDAVNLKTANELYEEIRFAVSYLGGWVKYAYPIVSEFSGIAGYRDEYEFICVMVGNNRIARSTDGGKSFSFLNITGQWFSVAYANGVFVATGFISGDPVFSRSTDGGITWSDITTPGSPIAIDTDGGVIFVSVGLSTIRRSINSGSSWSTISPPDGASSELLSIAHGNAGFVALSRSGDNRVSYSTDDGATWSAVAATQQNEWRGVAYCDGVFIAVAPWSVDWAAISAAASNSWRSIAYGNGVFVAISSDGTNRVMRSTDDGATWSAVAAAAANQWFAVAYGNGVFVAISGDGTNRVMRSTNSGASWSGVAAAEANTWRSIAYGNGVFVAISGDGTNRVMRSTDDGATWSAVAAAAANTWSTVTFGDGWFVTVASDGTNRVMRSTNGASWSGIESPQKTWLGLAYSDGVFIAVDNTTGFTMRSRDAGKTWKLCAQQTSNNWTFVAGGDGIFVAVANSGSNRIMQTFDYGDTWREIAAPETAEYGSVAFGNGYFISVAATGTSRTARLRCDNRVMRSTDDGATWSAVQIGGHSPLSVVAADDVFVAATGQGKVIRSIDLGETWQESYLPESANIMIGQVDGVAFAASRRNNVYFRNAGI